MSLTRPCPGGCGTPIPRRLTCCPRCSVALPSSVRRALETTSPLEDVTEHMNARAAALAWFQDHPPTGVPS